MNRTMRRWIKAGALIFIATLVVAACEGPAGPTGNAGADGAAGADGRSSRSTRNGRSSRSTRNGRSSRSTRTRTDGAAGADGAPGLVYVAMGFSYVPYNGAPGTNDADIPHRAEALPFGTYDAVEDRR